MRERGMLFVFDVGGVLVDLLQGPALAKHPR